MERKKRTIFWIIPIAILGIFFYFFGPKDTITDNEYIDYMKASALTSDSQLTTEAAFSKVCEKGGWEYFETKMFERVVEYKGKCTVEGKLEPVNVQFIVEKDKSSHLIGAMLVNSVQQTDEQRDAFIQTMHK
ncbi:glucosamine 6-phosphate synthetase [Solibacillus sp. R5-41]|uniref:glucosamine 6-phosphate synthetase n=1 Tax=Solibacillus sp. R5-41 TaxID=2048654 RepID=UPI000C127510|nr:glucosamine 6-phosphate synthetase [Solibacillus sp. R5-41]ATP39740.1 glucosamine 6-phosphate synthetase [Solibacillus sp. R5-41]